MIDMQSRAELRALAIVAARLFDVTFAELLSSARWHPLVHFRHLMWLVAHERGYRVLTIAQTYRADRTTVKSGVAGAQRQVEQYDWWAHRKADLIDAWDEELG